MAVEKNSAIFGHFPPFFTGRPAPREAEAKRLAEILEHIFRIEVGVRDVKGQASVNWALGIGGSSSRRRGKDGFWAAEWIPACAGMTGETFPLGGGRLGWVCVSPLILSRTKGEEKARPGAPVPLGAVAGIRRPGLLHRRVASQVFQQEPEIPVSGQVAQVAIQQLQSLIQVGQG